MVIEDKGKQQHKAEELASLPINTTPKHFSVAVSCYKKPQSSR